jgi:hypothetical protein
MDGFLNIDFTQQFLLLPIKGCDVSLATTQQQVTSVSRVVDCVRPELRQIQLESFRCGLFVDALSQLGLGNASREFFGIVFLGFKTSRLFLEKELRSKM